MEAGFEEIAGNYRYTPATIMKISRNTQHNYMIIDKGSADGVVTGSGVITGKGAIGVIDAAIEQVSKQRSTLGAVQNRLEHTIANLDTSAENLQQAESRIRDVDMAAEMVEYSKTNILSQASQSMLAQANQSTQGVLSLLQG